MKTTLSLAILGALPALLVMVVVFRLLGIDTASPMALWVLLAFGLLVTVMGSSKGGHHDDAHTLHA